MDVDLNCPTLATEDEYEGEIEEIEQFLEEEKPLKWRDEHLKLQDMSIASSRPGVTKSIRLRHINRNCVLGRQVGHI